MDPLAVPAAHNPLLKQGPDSPVSVFDFERRKSKSRSKSEYPGLYPPPRPPRKNSTSPPSRYSALRRCQSQPSGSPKQGSRREGYLQHQMSANILSELNNAGSNNLSLYGRTLDFESACTASAPGSPPTGKGAGFTGRGFSPLSGKENHDSQGKCALGARGGWSDEMNVTTACSEIEEICFEGVEKKRSCPALLQDMSPFTIWSNIQGKTQGLEHRKTPYSQVKADDVEEVIVNINVQKVSKKDLQLNPRESRRLVLFFILFNLLFGGLLVFRIPRAGETGLLTPRIRRPEQLLNLHGNFGSKLQFYRRLVGPRERLVAMDPGQGVQTQLSSESGSVPSNLQGELKGVKPFEAHLATADQQKASASGVAVANLSAT